MHNIVEFEDYLSLKLSKEFNKPLMSIVQISERIVKDMIEMSLLLDKNIVKENELIRIENENYKKILKNINRMTKG